MAQGPQCSITAKGPWHSSDTASPALYPEDSLGTVSPSWWHSTTCPQLHSTPGTASPAQPWCPHPLPVNLSPPVSLTTSNLVAAVRTVRLPVTLVAGSDAAPTGHTPEFRRSTGRTRCLGGCRESQHSVSRVPTSPRASPSPCTHGSRSRRSRRRSRSRHRSARA